MERVFKPVETLQYSFSENAIILKFYNSFNSLDLYVQELVQVRRIQGKIFQAQLFRPALKDGLELILYNSGSTQVLKKEISYGDLTTGKAYEIINEAFNTAPFNEPTPLEKLL